MSIRYLMFTSNRWSTRVPIRYSTVLVQYCNVKIDSRVLHTNMNSYVILTNPKIITLALLLYTYILVCKIFYRLIQSSCSKWRNSTVKEYDWFLIQQGIRGQLWDALSTVESRDFNDGIFFCTKYLTHVRTYGTIVNL